METIEFKETQEIKRKRTYSIYVLLFTLALVVYAGIQHETVLFLIAVVLLTARSILTALFYSAALQTVVNKDGVFFRSTRLSKYTTFNWSVVDKVEMVKVDFVGYGTWLPSLGTVYNVAGNTGLSIVLKTGKKVVIGTQKPRELTAFLSNINKLVNYPNSSTAW